MYRCYKWAAAAMLTLIPSVAFAEQLGLNRWYEIRTNRVGEAELRVELPLGNSSSILHVTIEPERRSIHDREDTYFSLEAQGGRKDGPNWELNPINNKFWFNWWQMSSGGCLDNKGAEIPARSYPLDIDVPSDPAQAYTIQYHKNACEEVERGRPYEARLKLTATHGDGRDTRVFVHVSESVYQGLKSAAYLDNTLHMEYLEPCAIAQTRVKWRGGVPSDLTPLPAPHTVVEKGGKQFLETDMTGWDETGGQTVVELSGRATSYGVCVKQNAVVNGYDR